MTTARPSVSDKRRTFRELHRSGCFVLPNPWDLGSALYLQSLGFAALATTSSGMAWTRARPDNGVPREGVLRHLEELAHGTDLPINADYENGFGATDAKIRESVRLAIATGVAGLSIEDATGRADAPLFDLADAVARLRAARAAIDESGEDVMLVGRAESFIAGRPDLAETVARLKAYADAGADCLYAPGLPTLEAVSAAVQAVSPKPLNVLVGVPGGFTLPQLEGLGVRRVSVGGALARSAWSGFMRAAEGLARGSFDGLVTAPTHRELSRLFSPR